MLHVIYYISHATCHILHSYMGLREGKNPLPRGKPTQKLNFHIKCMVHGNFIFINNKKKYIVLNCAKNKTFTRYWNTNVKHVQKKLSYYQKFNILHIPADKFFLSKCYDELSKKNSFEGDVECAD